MSSNLEFEGKNVDEAVDTACETLNITKKQLKFEVISRGSTGIFGLVGTRKARINVEIPDILPEKPEEKKAEPIEITPLETKSLEDIEPEINETSHENKSDPKILGLEVLKKLVDFITDGAQISVREYNQRILYEVVGGDCATLIGRRGQTLDAIQYIVEKVVNKQSLERVRLQVDVEGYLKKKRFGLQKLALRLAEKAKQTGKPWTTGQMNAHDRRVIHIALREDHDVRTKSIGGGFLRKMIIIPRKDSYHSNSFEDKK